MNFSNLIINLTVANRLTGIYDNLRNEECKKEIDQVDHKFIYMTEKKSRKNVELRALYRTEIDKFINALINE